MWSYSQQHQKGPPHIPCFMWQYWQQHHDRPPPHFSPCGHTASNTQKGLLHILRYPCGNTGSNTKMAHLTSRSPFGHTSSSAKMAHPTVRCSNCLYCQQHHNGPSQISFPMWPHLYRQHNGPPHISFPYLSILSAPTFPTTGTLKLSSAGTLKFAAPPVWLCAPNAVLTWIPPRSVSQVH